MPEVIIFVFGFFVTCMVVAAVSLLLWGTSQEPGLGDGMSPADRARVPEALAGKSV